MLPGFINRENLVRHIRSSLEEDLGSGDVTTEATLDQHLTAHAVFSSKASGIIAGCELGTLIFSVIDPDVTCDWTVTDGDRVTAGTVLGSVFGNARNILAAERLVLNYMQRMGGIATATRNMVDRVRDYGTDILDTRKTAPGLRGVDKWAVRIGGGVNHRHGLYDMILIKDNHIAASGGVVKALQRARTFRESSGRELTIEIEAKTVGQVDDIVRSGLADVIMLDNMAAVSDTGSVNTDTLQTALTIVAGSCRTEASGNVTLQTVRKIASTGVDAISSGSLTHSVQALDISLNVALDSA